MALRSTGPISFSDINQELGYASDRQISLADTAVRSLLDSASGEISLARGYGRAVGGAAGGFAGFVFTATIATNTANYNLKTAAIAAGWDQVLPLSATITINAGVYVYSVSTGSYAFDTGATFPTGTILTLINNGIILGMGGAGAMGGGWQANAATSPPGAGVGGGGPALRAQYAISITNNGDIAGGGGGGGGGFAAAY